MGGFLQQYGAVIVLSCVGLILVAMGIFGHEAIATQAGIFLLGGSAGTHLGGSTNLVPIKDADALAHIEKMGLEAVEVHDPHLPL